jgi:hypothetical protein
MWFKSECDKISDRLWDYSAQRLSASETAQIEQHLPHCARCQAEAAAYRQTLGMLGAARSLPVPASQTSWHDLRPALTPARRAAGRSVDWLPRLTLAGAGTAMAATLVVVFFSSGTHSFRINSPASRPEVRTHESASAPTAVSPAEGEVAQNQTQPAASDPADSGPGLSSFFSGAFAQLTRPDPTPKAINAPAPTLAKLSTPRHRSYLRIARAGTDSKIGKPGVSPVDPAAHLDGDNVTPRSRQNYVLAPVSASSDEETTHRYVISSIPVGSNGGTVASNDGADEGRAW